MEKINDGGPAFPVWSKDIGGNMIAVNSGMSLRDWFAGHALMGHMANSYDGFCTSNHAFTVSELCYVYADAMLKAREV